ncbi:MAG: hypothetical protein ACRDXX_03930 [Stackebrandtia sp.]
MEYSPTLTEAHIDAARTVYKKLAVDHDIRLAVVSGSLAFGLGHGVSDVDFYVMTGSGPSIGSRVFMQDGYPVQVNRVTPSRLDDAVRWAAGTDDFTTSNRSAAAVPDGTRKLAIRLTKGEVLHLDADCSRQLSQLSDEAIRRRVIAAEALQVSRRLEDTYGTLLCGDKDTAVMASRMALTHACEALLAACGDFYVGPVFLLRRLKRTSQLEELLPRIQAGLDIPGAGASTDDAADLAEVIKERARLASYLNAVAAVHGWDDVLTQAPGFQIAESGPIRDPFHTVLRFGDGIGLAGPDRGFKVSEGAARLWLSLDGRRHIDAIDSDSGQSLRDGVRRLVDIGAAEAALR